MRGQIRGGADEPRRRRDGRSGPDDARLERFALLLHASKRLPRERPAGQRVNEGHGERKAGVGQLDALEGETREEMGAVDHGSSVAKTSG